MARRGRFKDKAPAEVIDYQINFATRLGADTISGTPVWTITGDDAILVKDSQLNTTTTATATFSAGTLGKTYSVKCKIVTAGGRTIERTNLLRISVR